MTEETPKTSNASKYTNLQPNIAATLSYLFSFITGIAFFLIEKDDKFVRFHAMQSTILGVAAMVISFALGLTGILAIFAPLINLAAFIMAIMAMWKAYNNIEYELPIIGKYAKDMINKQPQQQ